LREIDEEKNKNQNNLGELWALLNFLMANILSSFSTFKRLFAKLSAKQVLLHFLLA